VWVRLLKAHALLLRGVRRHVPDGLTLPQFDALVQLARRPDGMTHGELSRALLVSPGNVTGLVGRLEDADLLERRPEPGDRRSVRLRLTARGRAAMARALPRQRRAIETLLAPAGARDLARLRALLGRLNRALEDAA
jgi:DNA-binding MarR family transcriptional regulator